MEGRDGEYAASGGVIVTVDKVEHSLWGTSNTRVLQMIHTLPSRKVADRMDIFPLSVPHSETTYANQAINKSSASRLIS
jgi:hypothetical protein